MIYSYLSRKTIIESRYWRVRLLSFFMKF